MFSQLRAKPAEFHVFDTTLRDGSQQEGLNLSVPDKLAIAALLDELGVDFIEGGWPGANPNDTSFFAAMADGALRLKNAQLVAFGFTRRVGMKAADDPLTAAVRESRAPIACIVAKSHDRHVEQALRTTLAENLAMISDTVQHLRAEGQRVFVDWITMSNGKVERAERLTGLGEHVRAYQRRPAEEHGSPHPLVDY